jgi:hypothetical protein
MWSIKRALEPANILNPGKVLPELAGANRDFVPEPGIRTSGGRFGQHVSCVP